ncbi:amidohydrolase family protein [uncultured Jatrophihabitans sp.]|uniref:amidohydrolase family protein n=1 Tax=uncultured Jatrophihabitans sp. TaxID=1610747 RepID=UPI0035CC7EF7
MSTVLRHARLVDGSTTDVLLDGDRIAAVGPGHSADSTIDLSGYVLLPSFVEPHAHLDKALTVSRSVNRTGDLLGAIHAMNEIADGFTHTDFVRRADAALRIHLAYGTTVVRSHVNIGSTFGLRALAALVEVREAWRGVVDLELVALIGHPILGEAGTNLKVALAEGADVAGGCPHLDPEPIAAVDTCLGIAGEAGVPLDLHTDETLNPGMLTLEHLADRVLATGFEHGVTGSHCVSLGVQPEDVQRRMAEKIAAAGMAIVALPQTNLYLQGREHPVATPRGLTAVRPLLAAGATVAAGGDNLRDAFHPVGRGDALEVGALMVTDGHLSVSDALRTLTEGGRAALRREPVAIEAGARADLVAVRAVDANEALGAASPDRFVWSGGRLVARTRVDTQLATSLDGEVAP